MKSPLPKIVGVVTINDKGQVVIPSEARAKLDLRPGGKLIALTGMHPGIIFVKPDYIESIIQSLEGHIDDYKKIVKDHKNSQFSDESEIDV